MDLKFGEITNKSKGLPSSEVVRLIPTELEEVRYVDARFSSIAEEEWTGSEKVRQERVFAIKLPVLKQRGLQEPGVPKQDGASNKKKVVGPPGQQGLKWYGVRGSIEPQKGP